MRISKGSVKRIFMGLFIFFIIIGANKINASASGVLVYPGSNWLSDWRTFAGNDIEGYIDMNNIEIESYVDIKARYADDKDGLETALFSAISTRLEFDNASNDTSSVSEIDFGSEDILFWAPADNEDYDDWGWNGVSSTDYIAVIYSGDKFVVANTEGSVEGSDENGYALHITKVNAASEVDVEGLSGNDFIFLNWIDCMSEKASWGGTVKFDYYNNDSGYALDYKSNYVGSYFYTKNIVNKLELIAKNGSSGMTAESVYATECLLRMLGNTYNKDAGDSLTADGESVLFYNKKWSQPLTQTYLSIVKEDGACSLVGNCKTEDITMAALYSFLEKSAADTSMPAGYLAIKDLASVIGELEGKIAEDEEENADDTAEEVIDSGNVSGKTAYEKWVDTVSNFIITDGVEYTVSNDSGTTIAGYENYDLKRFTVLTNAQKDDTKVDQKDTLSSEEILRLQAYIYCATKLTSMSRPVAPDVCNYPTSYVDININTGGYVSADVKALAESIVTKFDDYSTGVSTTKMVVQNLDSIVKYNSARLYGYSTGDPFVVEDVEDLSILSSSAYLDSITPSIDDVVTTLTYGVYLNQMTKMQKVLATDDSYEAYLQLNYLLMIAATYAQNDANLEESSDGAYTNDALDDFIAENSTSPLTADTSSVSKYIMSYLAIYRALDYLGVEPFTPQLEAIYNYYNQLISFEENESYKAYDPSAQEGEAMSMFFSTKEQDFNEDYQTGVALSATYIPLETNLYNTASISYLDDESWVQKFHYPYGFYRKALYIDTDINAAVNYYVTNGEKGTQKVATLGDLLEPEKDIVLYVDDNFYNVDELAEMQGYSYTKLANTDEAGEDGSNDWTEEVSDWWAEYTDTNVESVVKTGSVNIYSKNIKKKVSEYQSDENTGSDYVLTDKAIDKYLKGYSENAYDIVYDEYTPLQSYAVVSAIYRQTSLYNIIWDEVLNQRPVFISSPNLAAVSGIDLEEYNTIYNYIMLKNLEESLGIDYKTTLDLDSPIYIDIYGNIVTESGLVIIPAVSNATLCDAELFNVYNAGFLSLYNNGVYELPSTYNNSETYMVDMFEVNEETGTWQLRNKRICNVEMNFKDIPLSNDEVVNTFKYIATQNMHSGYLPFNQRAWLITEVLRGAPIESIDKEFEGLTGNTAVNKYGIYFAYKLDEIAEQLLSSSNGNSMIALPNLAFMTGVEYVILFAFKIIFAILFVLLFFKIYIDAVQGGLGIKTIASFVLSLVMFLVAAFTIPTLMDISYYQVNKQLLSSEVQYIEFLNLEKRNEGREIGVYEITEPETETELYIKIDNLTIPWYEILDDILLSSTFDTIDDVYASKFDASLMSSLPGVEKKGNGLYMSVTDIFDSTSIEYLVDNNALYSNVTTTPYASYILPYYVILDELIARVNYYNKENDIQNYTTKIQSKGTVKTLGMIEPFFTSEYFMATSLDVTGLKYINGVDTLLTETHALFDAEDLTAMQSSLWYMGDLDDIELSSNLDELDEYARAFVVDNRNLLGKVSDDTFLKVMAMSLAVKYNNIMGISSGNAIEIYDVDTRDLLRLSLEDKKTVLADSSKSFARFVYTNGGTIGVVFAAVLLGVYFIVSIIKPLCIFIIIGSTIVSVVIRRLVKKDKSKAIEGFLITLAILCGINLLYGVLLKLLMWIPDLGVTFVVAALFQIALQVLYAGLLVFFTLVVLSDWRDFGFNKYQQMAYRFGIVNITKASVVIHNASMAIERETTKKKVGRSPDSKTKDVLGENILETMKLRDERREDNNGKK